MISKIALVGVLAILLGGCFLDRKVEPVPGTVVGPTPGVSVVSPAPGSADEVPVLEEELESLNPDTDFPAFSDQDLGL